MDEKQAAMIGKLLEKPKFAMLQGLCSEVAQAQDNALNNKHKALHMQMITFTQAAIDKIGSANKGLGAPKPAPAPAHAPVHHQAPGSRGLGAPAPTPKAPSGDGSFNPANWDIGKYGVNHYVQTLYYLYDKLRTTDSGNPNVLIYLLEGLAKLSAYGSNPLLNALTSKLCTQMGALNHIFSSAEFGSASTNPQSFATLIAFALVTLALYQYHGSNASGDIAKILQNQYINGILAGNNPFLAKVREALSQMLSPGGLSLSLVDGKPATAYTLQKIIDDIYDHSGSSQGNGLSKILLQEVLESLFGGAAGSNDADGINASQQAVRQAFMSTMLAQLDAMEKGGASIAELLQFVMMEFNLASDGAGAYVGNINDLSALEGDTSTLLGLFAPNKYVVGSPNDIADLMSHLGAYYRLVSLWPNSPNITGGGQGSLEDILTNQLMDNLSSIKCGPDVLSALGLPTTGSGDVTWHGITFSRNASLSQLMSQFKGVLLNSPNSSQGQAAAKLITTLIGVRNHEVQDGQENGKGQITYKRDSSLDSVVSSLQAVESQVSSANETAKAQYQQANQTSANILSTGGDIMKDIMKMASTAVQNQRQGA